MKRVVCAILLLVAPSCAPDLNSSLPADFAALVPADAIAVVQLRSARELADQIESVRARVAKDAPRQSADDLLTEMLQNFVPQEDLKRLDLGRPMGLAVSLGSSVMEPILTLILPTSNPQELATGLEISAAGMSTAISGNYLALRMGKGKSEPGGTAPLMTDFPSGLLSARTDLGRLIAAYRPMIDMGLSQGEALMSEGAAQDPSMPLELTSIFSWYLEMIRDMLDSADRLDLSLDLAGPELNFSLRLTHRAGSSMAKIGRAERTDYAALAGHLDPKAGACAIMNYEQATTFVKFGQVYDNMLDLMREQSEVPPELVAGFETYLRGLREVMPAIGSEVAVSYDFVADGIQLTADIAAKDPTGLAKRVSELMRDPSLAAIGFEAGPEARGTMAGRTAITWNQKLNFTNMLRLLAPISSSDDLAENQLEAIGATLMGTGGLEVALLPGESRLGIMLGGNAAWRESMAPRLTSGGKIDPSLQRAIEPLAGANPGMIMFMDLREVLGWFARISKVAGEEDPAAEDLARALSSMGDQAMNASFYGGAQGADWIAGFSLDVEGLVRLVDLVESED